jgi:hypothetical protein
MYSFPKLDQFIDAIETCENPKGLCALSLEGEESVLATPANRKGYVRIAHY